MLAYLFITYNLGKVSVVTTDIKLQARSAILRADAEKERDPSLTPGEEGHLEVSI